MIFCNDMNVDIKNAMRDKDIKKIMIKASNSFKSQLDPDEIHTCKLNALWKAIKNFNPDKNTKFTTYLYQGVFIECLKELKFKQKSKPCNKKLHNNVSSSDASLLYIDILDEAKTLEERELIIDKIKNKTINEMANTRLYSRETVRKKLKKIAVNMKDKFN
jgi:DNA-directed RNA polymerase specialized sigma subunit